MGTYTQIESPKIALPKTVNTAIASVTPNRLVNTSIMGV